MQKKEKEVPASVSMTLKEQQEKSDQSVDFCCSMIWIILLMADKEEKRKC